MPTLSKEIRDAADLTQEELSRRIGRPHQSFIGKPEGRQAYLSAFDLRLILRACGVEPNACFRRIDELIAAEEE